LSVPFVPLAGALPERDGPAEPADAGDNELVRRFVQGDASAFDRIVSRHRDAVFRFVRWQLGGPRHEAEDATQDVFVEVLRSLPRYEGRSRLRTWVLGLARNVCLRRRRAAARGLPSPRDPAGAEETLLSIPDTTADVEAVLARRETVERVRAAIEELGPEHRAVVLLREIEGLSYEEIASVLDVPVGTVRSRLHNARAILAASLARAGATNERGTVS
jgi:RNA polymerase sigma-70 factor (ECF subfamily)